MTTAPDDTLLKKLERRVALLTEILDLTQRQRRCLEDGRGWRLERLIDHREHALRQWMRLERDIEKVFEDPKIHTLNESHKERLDQVFGTAQSLGESLKQEEAHLARAVGKRMGEITLELESIRKGRQTLQAYGKAPTPKRKRVVDRKG